MWAGERSEGEGQIANESPSVNTDAHRRGLWQKCSSCYREPFTAGTESGESVAGLCRMAPLPARSHRGGGRAAACQGKPWGEVTTSEGRPPNSTFSINSKLHMQYVLAVMQTHPTSHPAPQLGRPQPHTFSGAECHQPITPGRKADWSIAPFTCSDPFLLLRPSPQASVLHIFETYPLSPVQCVWYLLPGFFSPCHLRVIYMLYCSWIYTKYGTWGIGTRLSQNHRVF